MRDAAIIIPVYNEADNISSVIAELMRHGFPDVIVAIDPRTNDASEREAKAAGAQCVIALHPGYDSAIAAGITAYEQLFPDHEYVVFFDAGGKFPPDAIDAILEKARHGAELVLAVRTGERRTMFSHQKLGTLLVLSCINAIFGSHVTDISPFRVIRFQMLKKLDMQPRMFRYPSEMLVKCLALGARIEEVRITLRPRRGISKVSGNLFSSIRAGFDMLSALQFARFQRYTGPMPNAPLMNDILIAIVRIAFGVLWLHGASWKEPPLFGLQGGDNLYFWVTRAIEYPVWQPFTSLVSVLILPNFLLFAWMIFGIEILLGVLFVTGIAIRPAAILAIGMTIMIALTVLATPNEWPWSYALMGMVALLLFARPGERFRPRLERLFERP